MDSVEVPSSVGRIPAKIASGFAGFTADQWKNWILIYSLIALRNIIPDADYSCWTKFVDACVLLCSQTLTSGQISQAHNLIVQYCQAFQELYGKSACTINMHLACHMADCIRDFGPVHAFWCFSFERMNGQLGAIPTNNHSVEVQLMRKFVDGLCLNSFVHSNSEEVQALLQLLKHSSKRGTLSFIENKSVEPHVLPVHTVSSMENCSTADSLKHILVECSGQETIFGSQYAVITNEEHAQLTIICRAVFTNFHRLEFVCEMYSQMSLGGQTFGSSTSRLLRSSQVKAFHTTDASGQVVTSMGVGTVRKYVRVSIELNRVRRKISFALLEWYSEHPERHNLYPAPVEVWGKSIGRITFVPVASIVTRVAVVKDFSALSHSEILVTVPLLI